MDRKCKSQSNISDSHASASRKDASRVDSNSSGISKKQCQSSKSLNKHPRKYHKKTPQRSAITLATVNSPKSWQSLVDHKPCICQLYNTKSGCYLKLRKFRPSFCEYRCSSRDINKQHSANKNRWIKDFANFTAVKSDKHSSKHYARESVDSLSNLSKLNDQSNSTRKRRHASDYSIGSDLGNRCYRDANESGESLVDEELPKIVYRKTRQVLKNLLDKMSAESLNDEYEEECHYHNAAKRQRTDHNPRCGKSAPNKRKTSSQGENTRKHRRSRGITASEDDIDGELYEYYKSLNITTDEEASDPL